MKSTTKVFKWGKRTYLDWMRPIPLRITPHHRIIFIRCISAFLYILLRIYLPPPPYLHI